MKKTSALLIFSAMTLSAAALEPVAVAAHATMPMSVESRTAKAPARAEILGVYTIEYYDLTQITQSLYTSPTVIEAGTGENSVVITVPFINSGMPYDFQLKGTYSATDGTITFSKGQVAFGTDITYYLYDSSTDKENVVNTISCKLTDSGFSFDPNISIGLPAGGNQFYFKAGYISLYKEQPSDPLEGWTTIGIGEMEDGWLLPGLGINQTQYRYKVEIQSKDGETGVYRVVNPYGAQSPVRNLNESTAEYGFIEFNVSDPEHVYLYGSDAGFAYSKAGISRFYPNNTLGVLMGLNPGASLQEILTRYGDHEEMTTATFKDGVVIFPATGSAENGFLNDTNFGIQGAQFGGYGWTDSTTKLAKNMEARIFMPSTALTGVQATDEAPVRYFNLQGIEVSNPGHGVYIRTQGSKSEKVCM